MRKALLWGIGSEFSRHLNLIHYFEMEMELSIVGVTAKEELYDVIYGYTFYRKEKLLQLNFDLIIVMSDLAFQEIEYEIKKIKIDVPVVPCTALEIPGFNFDKYINIKENVPTIFSCNCWGGLMYHRLGLPFISPFINLFVKDKEFLRFLHAPRFYMNQTLEWGYMDYDKYLNKEYPVGICGDIEIHFNHYENYNDAKTNWEKRRERIRWDRIFVMMYTEDESVALHFSQLPYEQKVCFVPFKSEIQGICSIPYSNMKDIPFFEIVNGIASGKYHYFDILSILSGKVDKVADFARYDILVEEK